MIGVYVIAALLVVGLAASVRISSSTSAGCCSGWDAFRAARADPGSC